MKYELRIEVDGISKRSGNVLFHAAIIGEKNALGLWKEDPEEAVHKAIESFFKVNQSELENLQIEARDLRNKRETEQALESTHPPQNQQKL